MQLRRNTARRILAIAWLASSLISSGLAGKELAGQQEPAGKEPAGQQGPAGKEPAEQHGRSAQDDPAAANSRDRPAPAAQPTGHSHWAWQRLRPVTPPVVDGDPQPVDAFVLDALQRAGLTPSPPAPASQQLRRLWLDLVGLPPPPDVIQAFCAAPTDEAWSQQVDSLLNSPHLGERWARHWLDLVRYSETLGHEFDFELPNAWRYRDYVIRAFQDDVPYDQFVREHIAGDLLPQPRRDADGNNESVIGTAAWWFVEQTHAPVDAMQHQADRIDNQIDVLGKAFLATTVACARCHDHKFDPIPTRDYYRLFGYVQSSRYVQAPCKPADPNGSAYQRALTAQRTALPPFVADPMHGSVVRRKDDILVADAASTWSQPNPAGSSHRAAATEWFLTNDGFGTVPWRGYFCIDPEAEDITLHVLPGPFWLSCAAGVKREGTLATRTFDINRRYVHVRCAGEHSRIKLIIDGFHIVRNPIYGRLHRKVSKQTAHWLTFDMARWQGGTAFLQAIDQRAPDLGDPQHNRGRYPENGWLAVQSVVHSDDAEPPEPVFGRERGIFPASVGAKNSDWRQWQRFDELREAQQALPAPSPTVPALADGTGRDGYVFLRGQHTQHGEAAPRGFLSLLADDAATDDVHRQNEQPTRARGGGSGRLELADAMLAESNPLPARVLVNRLWHHLFGRGIVATVDNFGELGGAPSHPDLLDWLAEDFRSHGWSIHRSLRTIVMSRTYRQSSKQRSDAIARDPSNELLHRQNVRPLAAEVIRDSLLAVSGRLDRSRFGPSIQQPKSALTNARGKPNRFGPLDGAGRRSIYLAMRRNFMPEMLLAFDLPAPFATVGRRNTSNVPAQALALANAELVHVLCEKAAARILAEAPDDQDPQRIQTLWLRMLGRTPSQAEQERIARFLAAANSESARKAAWTDVAHALANTTEFRFCR